MELNSGMNKVRQLIKNNFSVIITLFSIFFLRTAIADWNHVPSGSMEPNLYDGDWLLVNKTEYGPTIPFVNVRLFMSDYPERGDVITFVPPHTSDLYVKRIIGIPGDKITFSGREIRVNGQQIESNVISRDHVKEVSLELIGKRKHLIQYSKTGRLPSSEQTIVVPEDKYFVLGDHRNNSADSRYWGFVESDNIMGKVTYVAFSTSSERVNDRFAIAIQ